MSRKHFGAALAVGGLLAGCQIAFAGVEEGSQTKTEIFRYDGWELSGAPILIWVVDSNKVADDNRAAAPNTLSSPSENDPLSEYHLNIPQAIRSNTIDNSLAVDPLYFQSNIGKGNSNNVVTFTSESAHPSRTLTPRRHATSMSPPGGCARCVGEVARATAGRAKLFAALFSSNFFRKGGSVVLSLHRSMRLAQPFVLRL
jgi:hypothetical protein